MNWWLFVCQPMKPELTQARLKELLHYDPETGVFTWLVRRGGPATAGAPAGTVGKNRYRVIGVGNRLYKAHRLAHLYMTGQFPSDQIDHVNRDRGDNRWVNLRPAIQAQNLANVGLSSRNTSGYKGVSWSKKRRKWLAQACADGRNRLLGAYDDIADAASAYRTWAHQRYGEFAVA